MNNNSCNPPRYSVSGSTRRNLEISVVLLMAGITGSAMADLDSFGPIDPANDYPYWYRDSTGLNLELCLDETAVNAAAPANLLCLLARTELPDPAAPVSFPDNFWPEIFWTRVDADLGTRTFIDPATGQAAGGARGALLVTALEGSFFNPDAAAGENISFGRIRIRIDNPVDGATLKVTHPFGQSTFVNVPIGARAVNVTEDIGIPVLPPPPPDYSGALLSDIGPFLRWTGPDFPVLDQYGNEYIGDPAIPHAMTGSPFNTNFFRIEGPVGLGLSNLCTDPALGDDPNDLTDCVETDLFIGSGKIAKDTDGDRVPDITDNCTDIANPEQRDTDADGFGNFCDTDLNNDQVTNGLDAGIFASVFTCSSAANPGIDNCDHADFNGDGAVNGLDAGIFTSFFLKPPG